MQKILLEPKNTPGDVQLLQVPCSVSSELTRCKDCNCILVINDNWYACNSRGKKGSIYLCKKCGSKRRLLWDTNNRDKKNITRRNTSERLKKEVIKHYGDKCACCEEENIKYLTIDHINGGGNKHRRELKNKNIYRWIKQNNFPDGFQVLCFNCNLGKGKYHICPHNKEFENMLKQTFIENSNSNNVRKSLLKLRKEIINGYGGTCFICGEDNPYFLTIDHVNNDGNIERQNFDHRTLYRKLKTMGFPKDKYQLLCFNCNCSKTRLLCK